MITAKIIITNEDGSEVVIENITAVEFTTRNELSGVPGRTLNGSAKYSTGYHVSLEGFVVNKNVKKDIKEALGE